jgi:hypothetical protein
MRIELFCKTGRLAMTSSWGATDMVHELRSDSKANASVEKIVQCFFFLLFRR